MNNKMEMPSPTEAELASPQFGAIWELIKSWDVNVPSHYEGYCGANGSHVKMILDALRAAPVVERQPVAWRWEWKTSREYDGWCYVNKHPDLKTAHLMDIEALYGEPPQFSELKTSLFKAIEHGDKGHREWLKSAIDAHFSKASMPDYVPSGKDNELAELQATIARLTAENERLKKELNK